MNEKMAALEGILVAFLRPTFLSIVSDEPNQFHIVISRPQFEGMSVNSRLMIIFDLLREHNYDILESHVVIAEAYSTSEMEDLIDQAFTPNR